LERVFRYGCFSIVTQFFACAVVWLLAALLSSDTLFGLIVYFYWPTIFLVWKLGSRGDIGPIVFGVVSGIFLYSLLFGLLLNFMKSKQR
jgi:hypothetical protein